MPDAQIDTIERSARSQIEWTPALLRAAEFQADMGQLRLAADLCDTMLADDRVKAVVDTRTDTLVGLPLSFEAGRGRRKNAAVRALEAEEDWWSIFPETELKLLHAWGILLGVGVARIVWRRIGNRDVPRLSVKNPRNLEWDENRQRWSFCARDKKIDITPGDGLWVLYTPYGGVRPWIYGAYRALSRWALLKQYARNDWGRYSERHGIGMLVAKGVPSADRKAVAAELRTIGRDTAMALPPGAELELLEATAQTYETFVAQIAAADNGYAITILGQNLTTQAGQTGNQGAASIHGRVALGRTKADAETISTTLHDQVLTHWAASNFGSRDSAPWPVWDTTPVEDLKGEAAVLQMLSQAISSLVQAGAPVDLRALLARYDVPLSAVVATEPDVGGASRSPRSSLGSTAPGS